MKRFLKYFPYLMSALSIIGCYFNILKLPISWIIWEGTAVGFTWYFIKRKDYGSSIVWIFYIFFDAYGWWTWTR